MFLNTRRNILATAFALAALACVPTFAADNVFGKDTINVGVLVDVPPFGTLDANNNPDGYDADFANLLGERIGVGVNLVPVTGPNRIPYLQTGRVDLLIAVLAITEERAQQVQFSRPYSSVDAVIVGRSDAEIASLEELVGVAVAVPRGSTPDVSLTNQAPEGTNIQRFDDDATALQALLTGQVSALGATSLVAAEVMKRAPEKFETKFLLFRQVMAVAMMPGNQEILDAVNNVVAEAAADGSLNAISQKWLGVPFSELETPSYVKQ